MQNLWVKTRNELKHCKLSLYDWEQGAKNFVNIIGVFFWDFPENCCLESEWKSTLEVQTFCELMEKKVENEPS